MTRALACPYNHPNSALPTAGITPHATGAGIFGKHLKFGVVRGDVKMNLFFTWPLVSPNQESYGKKICFGEFCGNLRWPKACGEDELHRPESPNVVNYLKMTLFGDVSGT